MIVEELVYFDVSFKNLALVGKLLEVVIHYEHVCEGSY